MCHIFLWKIQEVFLYSVWILEKTGEESLMFDLGCAYILSKKGKFTDL